MDYCKTCKLLSIRDSGNAPLWDRIHRTKYWDVVHSYNTSLEGWLVLVVRRHVETIAELTSEEAVELGTLLHKVSRGLQKVIGCEKTYVVQFAEHPEHPHVHFHVIPRMANQPEDRRSIGIFTCLGVAEEERVSEATMNDIAKKMREVI